MVVLYQMFRNQVRWFLGIRVQRARELQCEDFRVQSATICFKQTVLTGEESTLLTYAWAWKIPVNERTGRFSLSDCGGPWWTMNSASCFVLKQYVPSVHWCCESFFSLRSVVCCKNNKGLRYWQNHTGATVTKDGTRAQSTWWVERMK